MSFCYGEEFEGKNLKVSALGAETEYVFAATSAICFAFS